MKRKGGGEGDYVLKVFIYPRPILSLFKILWLILYILFASVLLSLLHASIDLQLFVGSPFGIVRP